MFVYSIMQDRQGEDKIMYTSDLLKLLAIHDHT
jgi:hypothetical protein